MVGKPLGQSLQSVEISNAAWTIESGVEHENKQLESGCLN